MHVCSPFVVVRWAVFMSIFIINFIIWNLKSSVYPPQSILEDWQVLSLHSLHSTSHSATLVQGVPHVGVGWGLGSANAKLAVRLRRRKRGRNVMIPPGRRGDWSGGEMYFFYELAYILCFYLLAFGNQYDLWYVAMKCGNLIFFMSFWIQLRVPLRDYYCLTKGRHFSISGKALPS